MVDDAGHIYLGVSVGFGHRMIRWADAQALYRWGGGPSPVAKPKSGPARVAHERDGILRHLVAWLVGLAVMGMLALIVGDVDRVDALWGVARLWTLVLIIDAIVAVADIGKARRSVQEESRR